MSILNCDSYNIYINEKWSALKEFLHKRNYSKIAVLVDENTEKFCLPELIEAMDDLILHAIQIPSGEINKNLKTCELIWKEMLDYQMDRHSCLINLGGGVIGDMGGFCAKTFMRGIDFIQIPTTLLSQVDASVGGKLGIDFYNYKNIIGLIEDPQLVWIYTPFLKTLAFRELRSGYAEIIKHALIHDVEIWNRIIHIKHLEKVEWSDWIEQSVKIKRDIVLQDKYEGGMRKILNFGHTIGHAIESIYLESEYPLLHGEAISIGMVMEAYISHKMLDLPKESFTEIKSYILSVYPHFIQNVLNVDQILENLIKDKKNRQGKRNFSLLNRIGSCQFDIVPTTELIKESIEAYIG